MRPYFKALCDDNRLEIIGLLLHKEHCVCELIEELELSQATVSYHIKILHKVGLIKMRYLGKSTYCSIDKEGFAQYASFINEELFIPVEKANPKEYNSSNAICR